MVILRRLQILASLILFSGLLWSVASTGGNFSLMLSEFISVFSSSQPSGGGYSVLSSVGQSIGAVTMSGGDFSLTGGGVAVKAAQSAYLKTDLGGVTVFPNPLRPGSGGPFDASWITFRNLTQQSTIRIYNIAGELVKTIESNNVNGEERWDTTNDSAEKVSSGVYFYYIHNPANSAQKSKGKLAIIK